MIAEISPELSFKKTRLAPTPSGYLHLGNVLSFVVTAAIAEYTNAKIVLRIDDVDRERTDKKFVQDIFDTLDFLDIEWHEGPRNLQEFEQEYSQMCRMDIYTKALQQLKDNGNIFACSCSRTDVSRSNTAGIYAGTCRNRHLSPDAENVCWRLFTDDTTVLTMKTLQGNVITTLPENMNDFVVRKKDGFPGYQLTSLMDDIYFGIDLIVRGEDLWPSSLAQLYLSALVQENSFANTTFYHHPLIVDAGEKLSKSGGATSVQYLRKQHKNPAQIYTLIAEMLGINAAPQNKRELVALIPL